MARMVTLRSDSDIVTKQESFKPNEMKRARGRETPGFFMLCNCGTSTSSVTAGYAQRRHFGGLSDRRVRSVKAQILSVAEPAEARSLSLSKRLFQKTSEISVTINENIRLYCETTRKR